MEWNHLCDMLTIWLAESPLNWQSINQQLTPSTRLDNCQIIGIIPCWRRLCLSYASCTLHWHHNGHDGISNHQPHDYLLNRLFRCGSKKTSKLWGVNVQSREYRHVDTRLKTGTLLYFTLLCVTRLCAGISPVIGELPTQRASYAENVFIWWCYFVWIILSILVRG